MYMLFHKSVHFQNSIKFFLILCYRSENCKRIATKFSLNQFFFTKCLTNLTSLMIRIVLRYDNLLNLYEFLKCERNYRAPCMIRIQIELLHFHINVIHFDRKFSWKFTSSTKWTRWSEAFSLWSSKILENATTGAIP